MRRPICFHSYSGGVGRSTLIAATALMINRKTDVTVNIHGDHDIRTIMGCSTATGMDEILSVYEGSSGSRVVDLPLGQDAQLVVFDGEYLIESGHLSQADEDYFPPAVHVLVVGDGYVNIVNTLHAPLIDYDFVIMRSTPGSSLRSSDIESALRCVVFTQVWTEPIVARAVDAGLLATRLPAIIDTQMRDFITALLEMASIEVEPMRIVARPNLAVVPREDT